MMLSISVDRTFGWHAIFPPERENQIKVGHLTTPTKRKPKKEETNLGFKQPV